MVVIPTVVKSDTQKAFKMINKNGIILWHDYVPGKHLQKIVKLINEISKKIEYLQLKIPHYATLKMMPRLVFK